MLRLEAVDFVSPSRWRWLLTGEGGEFLADQEVDLEAGDGGGVSDAGWEGFTDLEWFLRWRASLDRREASEAELVAQVGDWIAERALGPGIVEVLSRRPGPVHLVVPEVAGVLAFRPWQAARVRGRALAGLGVSLVTDPFDRPLRYKRAVGERLRVLAVFSLPEGAGALNLRRERQALARLVQQVATANDRAIELRVVQYGATRARLEDALLEEEGWDVLHLSGHGLPAGLVLEDETGQKDTITTGELVDLVDAIGDQVKLITLSACESAALTADDHLRLLGLTPTPEDGQDLAEPYPGGGSAGAGSGEGGGSRSEGEARSWGMAADGSGPLPAGTSGGGGSGAGGVGGSVAGGGGGVGLSVVATALVGRVDAAVLAMRYPVADDFAIGLAGRFYDLVLGKGQPVDKALGLALPRMIPDVPSAGVPAISVATPALFGARALGLTLKAPQGAPVVFEAERIKLARFPGQPERFVGRVGAMTRASTALAPRSGSAGVVFHGMAGAGKTACALELAYTHQDSFQHLIWHQAPTEDRDIASAFTRLAGDLEAQLPGLKLVHLAEDVTGLRGFLPTLRRFLEQQRVLVVVDNVESLLTTAGGWRDERWGLLVDALCVPGGLSRVVLTSRVRPAGLPVGLVVEAVHGLSLQESVLLAREWPNLKALIDAPGGVGVGPARGRGLAVRVLEVVQGHPKLIELAEGQAGDPVGLAARLGDVDAAWLARGVRLREFLDTGQADATDRDYYQVLDAWTRAAAAQLPEAARVLFTLLAGLEEDDRVPFVLEVVWSHVWAGLGHPDPVPDLAVAVGPLVERALAAVETGPDGGVGGYRIHPGVAESIRAAIPDQTLAVIDGHAADLWQATLAHGIEHEDEGMGWLVLRAGRSAAPYLTRQHQWATLTALLEQVLSRDRSPDTAAVVLPFLAAAVQATAGTEDELVCGCVHASALARVRPGEAEPELRRLLDQATDHDNHEAVSVIAGDLINLYRDAGRLEEALTLTDQMREHTRLAGHGPWTQLSDEGRRLQILHLRGEYRQVLDAVLGLREQMAALPETSDLPETIPPWNVRESTLHIGVVAASGLGEWQLALDLTAEILASKEARGATAREQAATAYNGNGPLQALGRVGEARAMLLECREVFHAHHDIPSLAKTVSALADIEGKLGHGQAAITLEHDALRLAYVAGDVAHIGWSHRSLAGYLDRHTPSAEREAGGVTGRVWAHRVAAAVIAYQTGSGQLGGRVGALARLLARPDTPPPGTFERVCTVVGEIEGVELTGLVERLPRRAPDGQAAMDAVLAAARDQATGQGLDLGRYLRVWGPVISALTVVVAGPPGPDHEAAAAFLDHELDHYATTTDWTVLTVVLRRVRAGERGPAALTVGLDEIDTAILSRALAALDGSDPIDATLWTRASDTGGDGSGDGGGDAGEGMAAFLGGVAAAAGGDAEAIAALTPVLDQMAADPDVASLAGVVRAVLAGQRDPAALTRDLTPAAQPLVAAILDALDGEGSDGPPTPDTPGTGSPTAAADPTTTAEIRKLATGTSIPGEGDEQR